MGKGFYMKGSLVNNSSGRVYSVGDMVATPRGEQGILLGWELPHHQGSSGRVFVAMGKMNRSFFPSVIDAEIVHEYGWCDECGLPYLLYDLETRCGDCGMCGDHCTHPRKEL